MALLVASLGTAFIVLALALHLALIRPSRPRCASRELNFDWRENPGIRQLLADMRRVDYLGLFGAALQLAGLVWQTALVMG